MLTEERSPELRSAAGILRSPFAYAALVLILRHFTSGDRKEVIVSRGELVQIGGGFRIPEILEASGARLREVGTTNKTTVGDYARAIGRDTALILKVHRSNFFMGGFVESPSTEELAAAGARKRRVGAPVADQAVGQGHLQGRPLPAGIGQGPLEHRQGPRPGRAVPPAGTREHRAVPPPPAQPAAFPEEANGRRREGDPEAVR